jgi:phosphonoacetate hydrolase
MLDRYFDAFDRAGAVLGITADHGMNAKSGPDGAAAGRVSPSASRTPSSARPRARVILPITDPYVVHHGALGSFATVYLDDATRATEVAARLATTSGIAEVYDNATGAARFELPRDRAFGDLIVIGETHTVLGKSPEEHDLSLLEEPLRSHGGVSEQTVPFVINRPLGEAYRERLAHTDDLRNFDLFDYVLNGVG